MGGPRVPRFAGFRTAVGKHRPASPHAYVLLRIRAGVSSTGRHGRDGGARRQVTASSRSRPVNGSDDGLTPTSSGSAPAGTGSGARTRFPAGTLARTLVTGVLAGRHDLGATAQLLYGFCFDRVELETPRLSYEPRWSCQCRKDCAAVWIASKSGAVMHIALATATGRPEQRWFPGDRAVRTICHVHDGTALGGGSFLLIGRDKGALDIVSDRDPDWTAEPPRQPAERSCDSIQLDSWWTRRDEVVIGQRSEPPRGEGPEYLTGVTAIAAFRRPGRPTVLDIVVATRYPWLYVIEAEGGT